MLDHNPATHTLATSQDRALFQLHNNGKIWRYTGTPITGWELIDQNPATVEIVAATNALYQRHRDGKIWRYLGTPITGWELIDQNPRTISIVAAGTLYQRHRDGKLWRYTGRPITGWELIDQNPETVQVAAGRTAGNDVLFQRHRNGRIWRYTGTPLTGWELIGDARDTRRIIVSPDGALYQLRSNGWILRYTGVPISGWETLDRNRRTLEVVAAEGGGLYQRRDDGTIWRYTGTPLTGWERIDTNPEATTLFAAAQGTLYRRDRDGKIWRHGYVEETTRTLIVTGVRCVDETEHEGIFGISGEGLANDAIRLKVISTSQKNGEPVVQQQSALMNLGSDYQDGTIVPMDLTLANFKLRPEDPLPMSIVASLVLVEEDWFGDISGDVAAAIRGYAEATRTVHGTLSALLERIPTPGFQIGATIGAIASVVDPAIAEAILGAGNDIFPIQDVSIIISDRNAPFAPGADVGVLRFSGHGGEYEISFIWKITDQVPSPPYDLI